jgi:hypothetical protein
LNKLSNENIQSEKFGLYLTKLNYWYQQYGGTKKNKTKEEKEAILKNIDVLYTSINFPYETVDFINNYNEFVNFLKTKTTDIEYSKKVNEVKKKLIKIIEKIYQKDPFLPVVCDKLDHFKKCELLKNNGKDTSDAHMCRINLNQINAEASLECFNRMPKN